MKGSHGNVSLVEVWKTNNRVTEVFIENLPRELWNLKIPGAPHRTVGMIAGHMHNARCMWIKLIGKHYGLIPPKSVDRRRVNRSELLRALIRSNRGVIELLNTFLHEGGVLNARVPWMNIPSDIAHVTTYLVAHEAHHRGQIVLVARQAGHRLPQKLTSDLWQWKKWHQQLKQ